MTATEAAIKMNVDYDYVLRLLRQGKLKGRKKGREWIVDAQSVKVRMGMVAS